MLLLLLWILLRWPGCWQRLWAVPGRQGSSLSSVWFLVSLHLVVAVAAAASWGRRRVEGAQAGRVC